VNAILINDADLKVRIRWRNRHRQPFFGQAMHISHDASNRTRGEQPALMCIKALPEADTPRFALDQGTAGVTSAFFRSKIWPMEVTSKNQWRK
jgi:hypothetical protein